MSGADARPSEGADRHARRQDRDDPGDVEDVFGHDEGEIGERDRQRPLGEPVVARPWNDLQEGAAGDHAERAAADEGADELDRAVAEVGRPPGDDDAEQDRVEHDRRRVVEQRLAGDEPRQTRGRADVAEDGDDRGGIGRRDHRAEQQADDQRHARRPARAPDRR